MACFRMAFFVFSCWNFDFSCGGFRYFVFSRGIISSFHMALFRLFIFSRGVFSRGIISGRKEEMAQTNHHTWVQVSLCAAFFYLKDRNILRLTASKAQIKALAMLIVVSMFSYELFPKCLFLVRGRNTPSDSELALNKWE